MAPIFNIVSVNGLGVLDSLKRRYAPAKLLRNGGFWWASDTDTYYDGYMRHGYVYFKDRKTRHPTRKQLELKADGYDMPTADQLVPFYELALFGSGKKT